MFLFSSANKALQIKLTTVKFFREYAEWTKCKPMAISVHNKSMVTSRSREKLSIESKSTTAQPISKQTRRGYSRKIYKGGKSKSQQLVILGNNAAGINKKRESLFFLINSIKPAVLTIQETKLTQYRTLKIPGYEVFEHLRGEKEGGGLLTAVLLDLDPVIVTVEDDIEILVVQFNLGGHKVRIINGYGPQEDDDTHKINEFWQATEVEIISAKQEGCLVIMQMDANAKIGNKYIKNDPNHCSKNGKILLELVQRQGMYIGNCDSRCNGTITRERTLKNKGTEKSVLDYFIFCERIIYYFEEMIIDDKRDMVLRHSTRSKGQDYIKSDHNILICKFSINCPLAGKKSRHEVFNFKSTEERKIFYEETCTTNELSECFTGLNFDKSCTDFLKTLNKKFHKCFSKIRIQGVDLSQLETLQFNPILKLNMRQGTSLRKQSVIIVLNY